MMNLDPSKLSKTLTELWSHGSLFLWALAVAALASLLVLGAFAFFTPTLAAPMASQMPALAVAAVVLLVFAGFKTYQEHSVKTLVLIANPAQSFWSRARQPDGRELTQMHLSGSATNTTQEPIYLTDVKLIVPRWHRAVVKHVIVGQRGGVFSSDDFIPAKLRADFAADFFVEGFIGENGERRNIVLAVSDQFGHWHRVRYPDLRST